MSNTLFTPNAILNEVKKPGKTPNDVFSLNLRKTPKTYNTGGGSTTYRDWNVRVGNARGGVRIIWNPASNPDTADRFIEISRGAIDPAKSEFATENKRKETCVTIETTIARAYELGAFEDLNDRVFNEIVGAKSQLPTDNPEYIKLTEKKTMRGESVTTIVREVKTPVSRFYSTRDKVPEHLRGKERTDPVIRYEIDFDKYPATFGRMANMPKTVVRDYNKPFDVHGDGKKIIYKEATVMNDYGIEEKLCAANAYKFLTRMSKIRYIVLNTSTVAIHDKYVSNKVLVSEIVVESCAEMGSQVVGDDGEVVGNVNIIDGLDRAFNAPIPAPATSTAPTAPTAASIAAPTAAELSAAVQPLPEAQPPSLNEEAVQKLLAGMKF